MIVVPILYTNVGVGEPVVVTLELNATDALQLLRLVETLIFVVVSVGAWFTIIDFVETALPQPLTVYEINAVPTAILVTNPELEFTVATDVLLLLHTPPVLPLLV
jgi:hypothetical protein